MRFTATAGVLAAASAPLALVLGDAPNLVNALRMVQLTASGGEVSLTVNTLDRAATVSITAEIERLGEATARCAEFAALLARLPAEQTTKVTIGPEVSGIEIRTGRSRYTIPGLSIADLPAVPELTANAALHARSRRCSAAAREHDLRRL